MGTGDDTYSVEFKGFDYFPPGYEIPRVHNGFGGKNEQYMDRTMDWDVLLKLYGTFKKGQNWVMPIPIWINDFKTGNILPIMYDFPIVKESEAVLQQHELAAYPTVDFNGTSWGNPNFNKDGSPKSTRTYYRKAWRVPYDR